MWCLFFFFFFKQKTAYEMRISDWSSDVCSSDLPEKTLQQVTLASRSRLSWCPPEYRDEYRRLTRAKMLPAAEARPIIEDMIAADARSEEHTSELQSLMRISYAVFCLKKKHNTSQQYTYPCHSTSPITYSSLIPLHRISYSY